MSTKGQGNFMSRAIVAVDKDILEKAISKVEASGPLANRSELFKKVTKEYETVSKTSVSIAIIVARIDTFGLVVTTPKGKRGRPKLTSTVAKKIKAPKTPIVSTETNEQTVNATTINDSGEVVTEEIPVMNKDVEETAVA